MIDNDEAAFNRSTRKRSYVTLRIRLDSIWTTVLTSVGATTAGIAVAIDN